jgi:hypothetical protein
MFHRPASVNVPHETGITEQNSRFFFDTSLQILK